MARKTRRLAPRDAFIGVRDETPPAAETEAAEPASKKAPQPPATEGDSSEPSPQPQAAAASTEAGPQASPPSPSASRTPAAAPEAEDHRLRELAKALQASSRGYAEKLTIYLSADVSAALADLWEKTRRETGVKIGKATLAQAALALVLDDPALRIAAVERALKTKLGGSR